MYINMFIELKVNNVNRKGISKSHLKNLKIRVFRRKLELLSVLFFRAGKEEWIDLEYPIAERSSLSIVLLGIEGSVGYSMHIDPALRVNTIP